MSGYPHPVLMGVFHPVLTGGTLIQSGLGGTPSVEVWSDTQSENITFSHPSDVGGN